MVFVKLFADSRKSLGVIFVSPDLKTAGLFVLQGNLCQITFTFILILKLAMHLGVILDNGFTLHTEVK